MGIMNFIKQEKEKFRAKQDSNMMRTVEKTDRLREERERVEKINAVKQANREERKALMNAKYGDRIQSVKGFINNVRASSEKMKKSRLAKEKTSNGFGFGGNSNFSLGGGSGSPAFNGMGFGSNNKPEAKPRKHHAKRRSSSSKGTTIIIKH